MNEYLNLQFMFQYPSKLFVIMSDYFRQITGIHECNTREYIFSMLFL